MKLNRPANTHERPTYPQYRERFGEDPARYLCTGLDPWPRLRVIDDPDHLRAFVHVAAEWAEPDRKVIGWCNQRIDTLEEKGDGGGSR